MTEITTLCDERHKNIESTLDAHLARLNNHGDRLDRLENNCVRTETIVTNLCTQIKSLTNVLWWMIGLSITTGVGFIIWYIQSH